MAALVFLVPRIPAAAPNAWTLHWFWNGKPSMKYLNFMWIHSLSDILKECFNINVIPNQWFLMIFDPNSCLKGARCPTARLDFFLRIFLCFAFSPELSFFRYCLATLHFSINMLGPIVLVACLMQHSAVVAPSVWRHSSAPRCGNDDPTWPRGLELPPSLQRDAPFQSFV